MSSPQSSKKIPIHGGDAKSLDMPIEILSAGALFDAAMAMEANGDVEAYEEQHQNLLKREEQDAWDREARPKAKSRSKDDITERRAAAIVLAIREYERKVVFGNLASEAIPGPDTRDMGGQFLTNKPRIDAESKLFEIAKMVPKGCLLHLHFNAELYPDYLLAKARSRENMYIRSTRPLITQEDLDLTETVFNVLDHDKVEKGVDIFSPDYVGNATNWKTEEYKWRVWMPWLEFRARFKEKFGKEYTRNKDASETGTAGTVADTRPVQLEPAENWLKKKMVLSEEEAYDSSQTVNGYVNGNVLWRRGNIIC